MNPLTISALISAGTAALGGRSSSKDAKNQQRANEPFNKFQEKKYQLVDDLLASLDGSGKYGRLFQTDEKAFQKTYVDPAKQMFSSQIAPQIQQGAIAGGMQRSSSLDDQLMRAGVDLDQLLNQSYLQFQNQGKDRMTGMLGGILGTNMQQPLKPEASSESIWGGQLSGFLQGPAFSKYADKKFGSSRPGYTNEATVGATAG